MSHEIGPERYGWSVKEWAAAAGISRASVYLILDELESVKHGDRRIVITHPRDWLASLKDRPQQDIPTETPRQRAFKQGAEAMREAAAVEMERTRDVFGEVPQVARSAAARIRSLAIPQEPRRP